MWKYRTLNLRTLSFVSLSSPQGGASSSSCDSCVLGARRLSALNLPANSMSCFLKKERMSRWGDHRQGRLETGFWWGKVLEPWWFCPPVRCCPALSIRAGSRLATELWKPSPYLHPHRCFPLHGRPPLPLGHQPLQLGNPGETWFGLWNSCRRSVLITVWSFVCFLPLALDFSKETNGALLSARR